MRKTTELDAYIGEKIREYRIMNKLSQTELASYLGVTFQQIQKYEKSINRITVSRLCMIAEALDVPIEYFLPLPRERCVLAKNMIL